MSPRPPPKISPRHDWTKELGSKVDHNQKEKLLDNKEEKLFDKQNSSNQPNQFQIQFVIDQKRLGITQDVIGVQNERKTSRSQEISVNSNEELCSSDRSGRLGITHDVIKAQTNLSEMCLLLKVKRPVPTRSMKSVCLSRRTWFFR